jgi:hypothetical protein
MKYLQSIFFIITLLVAVNVGAEIPTVLTDTIKNGDGIIDIFKDATSTELEEYLQGGSIYLGVDINEDASGIESSTSSGVAIKEMELIINTTEGDFTFTEFYTNTTALITEQGTSEAQEFYALFGSTGSNELTGGTTDLDISQFDDIIVLDDISFSGDITGASLSVTFLDTAAGGDNESFFDYSAGFEQFAILSSSDAELIEAANIGLGDAAPQTIAYDLSAPAGTPEPTWVLLLMIPGIFLWRKYRH